MLPIASDNEKRVLIQKVDVLRIEGFAEGEFFEGLVFQKVKVEIVPYLKLIDKIDTGKDKTLMSLIQ